MNQSTRIYDQTAAAFASKADRLIGAGRYRRGELFLSAALERVPSRGNVLDYGCGPGRISVVLSQNGFRVRGIDPSSGMIAAARQQNAQGLQLEFHCHDSIADQPENFFDGVVCSSVIEYVSAPEQLLGEFCRVLRPGGSLIISFANSRSISRKLFERRNLHLADQKHVWNAQEFNRVLTSSGFVPVRKSKYYESFFDRLAPLGFLSRSQFIGTLGLVVATTKSQP